MFLTAVVTPLPIIFDLSLSNKETALYLLTSIPVGTLLIAMWPESSHRLHSTVGSPCESRISLACKPPMTDIIIFVLISVLLFL